MEATRIELTFYAYAEKKPSVGAKLICKGFYGNFFLCEVRTNFMGVPVFWTGYGDKTYNHNEISYWAYADSLLSL